MVVLSKQEDNKMAKSSFSLAQHLEDKSERNGLNTSSSTYLTDYIQDYIRHGFEENEQIHIYTLSQTLHN